MSILLVCHRNIHVNFGPEIINGKAAPIRSYRVHEGDFVVLEGYADEVLRHDAEVLLSGSRGHYRMPTPEEQDHFMQMQRARGMIQEGQEGA
jgi:hypothetical protein